MKCSNCNAEIKDGSKFCEYCGTQITPEMRKAQEQVNKDGCPRCGSSNITFNREKLAEVRDKSKTIVKRSTVGVCKDCGYTWHAEESAAGKSQGKRHTLLWVLGWIFCFPIPATILIWRKQNTWDKKIKIAATVAVWLLLIILSSRGGSNSSSTVDSSSSKEPSAAVSVEKEKDESPAAEEKGGTAEAADKTEGNSDVQEEEVIEAQKEDEKEAAVKSAEEDGAEVAEEDVSNEEAEQDVPQEYKNALKRAEKYSAYMHMSKQGIYDQLTSEYGENFPEDAAQYAIDNLDADYKENALKEAETYSKSMHMSKQGIYDQLTSEFGGKFTEEEAQYAIDNLNADYKENALKKAETYYSSMGMSKESIYEQLTSEYGEKFTEEEAQYAVDNLPD